MARFVWYPAMPAPPHVELEGIDPAVAKAVEQARGAVQNSPHSATAWGHLGLVLAAHDFLQEAHACFIQAERLDAREARWPYHQGLWLMIADPNAAIAKFRRAAELNPTVTVVANLHLGDILLAEKREAEAEEVLSDVLHKEPANPRAQLTLGRLALRHDSLEEARRFLRPAATSPFTRKAAHALLAEIDQRLGDSVAARNEARLVNSLPADLDWPDPFVEEVVAVRVGEAARYLRAASLFQDNHIGESITVIQATLTDYPKSARSWILLARAALSQGNASGGEQAARTAVRLAPDDPEGHVYLGIALLNQGDYGGASTGCRRAAELKPDYTFAYMNLGRALKLAGDAQGAIDAFGRAIRSKPDYAPPYISLAELLNESGRHKEALGYLRAALQVNPDDAAARRCWEEMLKRGQTAEKPD
jgi:tetratricopeptide (TPR) repeat protein